VQVDLHVLGPLVLNRVGGEVHYADVVTVDERAPSNRAVKHCQELSEPGSLRHAVSHSSVLRVGTGAGDNQLPLGRPGDKVAALEDDVAGGRPASVRRTSPVSVCVDDELSRRRPMEEPAVVNCATEVAEEALQSSEVWLFGIMHVKADLLNRIGDIRPGKSEVLESTSRAPVGSGISN